MTTKETKRKVAVVGEAQIDEWAVEAKRLRELSAKHKAVWKAANFKVRVLVTKLHEAGGLTFYEIAKRTGYSDRYVRSLVLTTKYRADIEYDPEIRPPKPSPENREREARAKRDAQRQEEDQTTGPTSR